MGTLFFPKKINICFLGGKLPMVLRYFFILFWICLCLKGNLLYLIMFHNVIGICFRVYSIYFISHCQILQVSYECLRMGEMSGSRSTVRGCKIPAYLIILLLRKHVSFVSCWLHIDIEVQEIFNSIHVKLQTNYLFHSKIDTLWIL